jgi:hypothetical protein
MELIMMICTAVVDSQCLAEGRNYVRLSPRTTPGEEVLLCFGAFAEKRVKSEAQTADNSLSFCWRVLPTPGKTQLP